MSEADECEIDQAVDEARAICLRCGQPNDSRASRCENCHAPLDTFAATSPWEMGTMDAPAKEGTVEPRLKPVVFWGVWLIFGPSALGTLWMVVELLIALNEGGAGASLAPGEWAGLMISALLGGISLWVLWSVTRRYFGASPTSTTDAPPTEKF